MGNIRKGLETLLILFGLYLVIQIIRKILGGSWDTEDIILGLLILSVGTTFTVGFMLAELKSDHNHLKQQFSSLAADFKSHLEQGKEKR